jgi:hypothetical protein
VMTVAGFLWKGCTVACPEHRFAAVFDQTELTFEDVNEFVFVRVSMALTRPIARRQTHEIGPKVTESAGVA